MSSLSKTDNNKTNSINCIDDLLHLKNHLQIIKC